MNDPLFFLQDLPDSPHTFRMLQVPSGQFRMGSPGGDPDAYDDEKPHPVRLDGFWMAEHPVTQALWEAVMHGNPAHFKGEQRPVETVSWFDAAVFCNALSKLTERPPVYLTPNGQPYGRDGNKWVLPNEGELRRDPKAMGYRLPTEAEWEFAARGGLDEETKGKGGNGEDYKYSGSDLLDQVGWYAANSGSETHDVGLLLPNAHGLHDMSGNVYEWCEDWWGDYTAEAQENPRGATGGVNRVFRGGFWGSAPQYCRPAYRNYVRPDYRDHLVGFRLALSLQSVG